MYLNEQGEVVLSEAQMAQVQAGIDQAERGELVTLEEAMEYARARFSTETIE